MQISKRDIKAVRSYSPSEIPGSLVSPKQYQVGDKVHIKHPIYGEYDAIVEKRVDFGKYYISSNKNGYQIIDESLIVPVKKYNCEKTAALESGHELNPEKFRIMLDP